MANEFIAKNGLIVSGDMQVQGNVNFDGSEGLIVSGGLQVQGDIILNDLTYPSTDGSLSGDILVTDASGSISITPNPAVQWVFPARSTGATYAKNEMTRVNEWTVIANKVTTDFPAPQPSGQSFFQLGDTPLFNTVNNTTSPNVFVGQRYTFPQDGYFNSLRIWATNTNPDIEYALSVVANPLTNPVFDIIGTFSFDTIGWHNIPLTTKLIESGSVFDVTLEISNITTASSGFLANYVYRTGGGDPINGRIQHQNNLTEMRINYTDDDAGDQQANLQSLKAGDKIAGGGINWEIIQVLSQGASVVSFSVSPAIRLSQATRPFTFTVFEDATIPYSVITDQFSGNVDVSGFFSDTSYTSAQANLDNNAYGVDVELQGAIISDDWDIVAFS